MVRNMNIDKNKLFRNADILDEAVAFGYKLCQENQIAEVISLLDDVATLLASTEALLAKDDGHLVPLAIKCCKNMQSSIESFKSKTDKKLRIYRLEIMNLMWNFRKIIDNQYNIIDGESSANGAEVYLERARQLHEIVRQNKHKKYKYKASIVVVAYNKLEYTKAAIESIYKYTDFSKGDIELITRNNGSSDGTEEYFESLPNAKKINLKYNALGIVECPDIVEGRYVVGFSNDVVATPHWLDNLIECIESDDDIAWVVPTCQDYAISCNQGIRVDYQNTFADLGKMERFAGAYNRSNPSLWEERFSLMPFVGMYRHELYEADLVDPRYVQAQFVDDDISTVLRRTGWKQILARDTFMHHFGSVTLRDESIPENNMAFENMRQVYFNKWGVDAWNSKGCQICAPKVLLQPPKSQGDNILWLNPFFGADFLLVKTEYRKAGIRLGKTKAIVTDKKYQMDAEAYFDETEVGEDISGILAKDADRYNLITMSCALNGFGNADLLDKIKSLYEHLADDGTMLLPIENQHYAGNILNFLADTGIKADMAGSAGMNIVDADRLLKTLKSQYQDMQGELINIVDKNKEIAIKVLNGMRAMQLKPDSTYRRKLGIKMFWLHIKKHVGNKERRI